MGRAHAREIERLERTRSARTACLFARVLCSFLRVFFVPSPCGFAARERGDRCAADLFVSAKETRALIHPSSRNPPHTSLLFCMWATVHAGVHDPFFRALGLALSPPPPPTRRQGAPRRRPPAAAPTRRPPARPTDVAGPSRWVFESTRPSITTCPCYALHNTRHSRPLSGTRARTRHQGPPHLVSPSDSPIGRRFAPQNIPPLLLPGRPPHPRPSDPFNFAMEA